MRGNNSSIERKGSGKAAVQAGCLASLAALLYFLDPVNLISRLIPPLEVNFHL
jgi:hypothetical protein